MKEVDSLRRASYSLQRALHDVKSAIDECSGSKPRILFVAPHLSTGGMPQYLYKKIECLIDEAEIFCVEYSNVSDAYVVQRNRIINLIGNRYFQLDENKSNLLEIIEEVCPDVIHFDDFVEFFVDDELCKTIFSPNRPYYIFETCHSSNIRPEDKLWAPDKLVMVNEWMIDKFENLGIPLDLLEYPIENYERPDRTEALLALGLDPNKKHVINVGLFTSGKNQGQLIGYARDLQHLPIEFHFIGNQASNFQEYWEPLMRDLPPNCRIWGERDDTDKFYCAADLFVFTSTWELNPIVIKECLSWNLPILLRRLDPYKDFYDENPLVTYLSKDGLFYDRDYNLTKIKEILKLI
jgi:glycosyltransferase involved in cell wall biosynthesis